MAKKQVVVREVDEDLWREVRVEAVRRGLTAGELLNEIISEWLARQQG